MKIEDLRNCIISATNSVIHTDLFTDMVQRNWHKNQGNEEEIYPYFAEELRRLIADDINGIGAGKVKDRNEKVDCLIDLPSGIYAVELKGPSKDRAYVASGLEDDFKKLSLLESDSCIAYGIAIGIFTETETSLCNYQRVLDMNGTPIGIRIEIKDTLHPMPPSQTGSPLNHNHANPGDS